MNMPKRRKFARGAMAIASTAIIVGGTTIYEGLIDLGDALMIGGAILLILGVAVLAQTPPENGDAG